MVGTGTSRNPEWHMSVNFPRSDTYRERAKECRELAKVSPWHQSYFELAAKYEQLASTAEKDALDRRLWWLAERWLFPSR
jgi:hypothetical protein